MKLGVFLEQNLNVGGGFQQAYSVLKLLQKKPLKNIKCIFFVFTRENEKILRDEGINAVYIGFSILRLLHRIKAKFFRVVFGLLLPFQGHIDKLLDQYEIDLVYFLTPSPYAMGLKQHNYIVTVWDQCHRDWMEFPEVYADFEFELREFFYRQTLFKAVAVLVDSAISKQKLHERYGVDLERIQIAPFFPSKDEDTREQEAKTDIDVCKKYSISLPFLFYPAQLWTHKNHIYILDALALLRHNGLKIAAVFVGNDFGNKFFLAEQTRAMGLIDQVYFLGFIPRQELIAFYKKALALVMPTYFGPTNIPPLEAFSLKCPVCYPNLPGLREQVADGAFLMDLDDPKSLCNIVKTLLFDKNKVEQKLAAGVKQLELYSEENYLNILCRLFNTYSQLLRCRRRI
ncbi:MAG: glycosyltransferase family 4 protein [Synergistaceae bacterium]|jgi:glycosyltransferase involved in cell wall biosynthesis|nr:glycosyltransferase family 4 protein [Synergistaceae bacterium]